MATSRRHESNARDRARHAAARSGRPAGSRGSTWCCLAAFSCAARRADRTWKPRRCRRRSPPPSRAPRCRTAGSRSSSPTRSGRPSTRWWTTQAWWCCTRTPSAPPAGSRSSPCSTSAARRSSNGAGRWARSSKARTTTWAAKEDSPVRLMFAFDGDKSRLPLVDRAVFYLAEKLSGRELPYALLQYVWANTIPGRHRARQSVHAAGADAGGRERSRGRGQVADADAQPATTTSATRSTRSRDCSPASACSPTPTTRAASVEAWYGDIRFLPGGPVASGGCPRRLHAAPRYAAP